jgi:Putative Ig domain
MHPELGRVRARLLVLGFIVLILVFASGCSGLSSSAKNINPPVPVQFSGSTLPSTAVGSAYSATLKVTGGTAPYGFTVVSGALPSGLSLSSTTGVISGTPTASGQFSFKAQVSDSSTPPQTAQASSSISVNPRNGVVISTAALPSGTVGTAYSTTLTATGGTAPYSWTVASGTLPAGLSLSQGGAISGTPTGAGQSNFTVQATDSSSPVQKAIKPFSLSTSAAGMTLTITSGSLPNGVVGTVYSSTLTATGGTTPYSWTVVSGTLPAGLSLSQGGTISGTPTRAGQSSFTVQVTDSSSPVQKATTLSSISVSATPPTLTITTASLPNGTVGTAYSSTVTATGGTTPYSWTLTSGALPAGLSLSKGGTISGTPTSAGQSNFTVQVTDASSSTQKASKAFDPTIISKLAITGTIKPNAVNGQAYLSTDVASGGTPAYTWSIAAGALPPGLNLAATTGTISGSPNQDGVYNFTLKVVDSGSPVQSATQPDKITVVTGTNAWALQPTQVGWQFVAPDSGITCKYVALSKVDDADAQSGGTNCPTYGGGANCDAQMQNKYAGSWGTWANQQSDRLTNLGFTAAGTFSYRYGSNRGPSALPVASTNATSAYAMNSSASHTGTQNHIKNAAQVITPGSMVCGGSMYQGGWEMDPYDPQAQAAMNSEMAYWVSSSGAFFGKSAIIAVPEDGDSMALTNQREYHVDGGLFILINNPMVKTGKDGHNYGDATYYVKQALSSYLQTKYGTIAALNAAWGTSYTTFLTSDSGGTAGIAAGTYTSYGTGTGLLDENGSHVISAAQQAHCGGSGGNGPSTEDNWATNAQIKTDGEAFMAQDFAPTRANLEQSSYVAACGASCPPLFYPLYDGPGYIYSAMQSYFSGFWLGFGVEQNNETLAHDEGEVAYIAGQTTAPLIVADYIQSDADSQIGAHCGACSSSYGWGCQATQAAKASNMIAFWQDILPLKNTNGKFAVVGLEHWSMYDSMSQCFGPGLFSLNDNAYDGSQASTMSSAASYSTSHSYSAPAIVTDGIHIQSLRVASGTSGGSAPSWNANEYGQTLDNTAKWLDIGSYTLIPEGSNFGNSVGPIRDFLAAGICDP